MSCDVDLEVESDGPLTVRLDGCSRRPRRSAAAVRARAALARACRAANGFLRVGARPRGRRLLIEAAQVDDGRFDVDVFRQSRGRRVTGELRVRRFRGVSRVVPLWRVKAAPGVYMVRFAKRLAGGRVDVRRVVVERRGRALAAARRPLPAPVVRPASSFKLRGRCSAA